MEGSGDPEGDSALSPPPPPALPADAPAKPGLLPARPATALTPPTPTPTVASFPSGSDAPCFRWCDLADDEPTNHVGVCGGDPSPSRAPVLDALPHAATGPASLGRSRSSGSWRVSQPRPASSARPSGAQGAWGVAGCYELGPARSSWRSSLASPGSSRSPSWPVLALTPPTPVPLAWCSPFRHFIASFGSSQLQFRAPSLPRGADLPPQRPLSSGDRW